MSLGDFCDEGTPGNISNPEVKVVSADGTWGAAPWESRSLPRDFSFNHKTADNSAVFFMCELSNLCLVRFMTVTRKMASIIKAEQRVTPINLSAD